MPLFLVADFFRRRRPPRRMRDELPVQPLLDVLGLWALLAMGGLMGSISATALVAFFVFDLPLERELVAVLVVLLAIAFALLGRAVRLWFRLNRS